MPKFTIVIADEDRMQATLLAFRLKNKGYHVVQFSRGQLALDYLNQYNADLLLCGADLQGYNGLQLLNRIQASKNPHIPVIFILQTSELRLQTQLLSKGASLCLPKPVMVSDLLSAVAMEVSASKMIEN